MLRAPFIINSLRFCRDAVKVTWQDGAASSFPSVWLRASTRDPKFFDQQSLIHRPEHLEFLLKDSQLTSVEQSRDGEDVTVQWQDHKTHFNSSWLRAQDSVNLAQARGADSEERLWSGGCDIPVYEYSQREKLFDNWMADLKKWGLVFVHGCPTTEKDFLNFCHMIGPLWQRYHPTNLFYMRSAHTLGATLDYDSYGSGYLAAHTDTTYQMGRKPVKIEALMGVEYDAPQQDTINFFSDGFKVIDDLRKEEPEVFRILSTTTARQARRRMDVEEQCEDPKRRNYQWDTYLDSPPIVMEGDKVTRLMIRFAKHGGFPFGKHTNEEMENFYQAYAVLRQRLNDPSYQQRLIFKPGVLAVFDNHRICHGRLSFHPSTHRYVLGSYIQDEIYRSRMRILLGKKSGLEDKWLMGCSDEALEVLASRMEESVESCANDTLDMSF